MPARESADVPAAPGELHDQVEGAALRSIAPSSPPEPEGGGRDPITTWVATPALRSGDRVMIGGVTYGLVPVSPSLPAEAGDPCLYGEGPSCSPAPEEAATGTREDRHE
jgi:hypothetical protein